jgi:hypothetical protein
VTSTKRNKEFRDRTAWMLPNIALDETHATKLRALCTATGKTATAVVRSLIDSARIPKDAK